MRLKRKVFYNEARVLKYRLNISYRQAKKLSSKPAAIEQVIVELVSKQMESDFQNYAKDLERMQREAARMDYSQKGTVQGLWKQLFENGRVLE